MPMLSSIWNKDSLRIESNTFQKFSKQEIRRGMMNLINSVLGYEDMIGNLLETCMFRGFEVTLEFI